MKKIILCILTVMGVNYNFLHGATLTDITGSNTVKQIACMPAEVGNEFEITNTGIESDPVYTLVINQFDTVFFDIAQAVINGSSVEFPVYFRSDDVINALDFAFKYDQSHLLYDTIINLTTYIEPLSYYNPNDSTVRLTSYSFTQPYSNDVPLLTVRFTLLSGQLCSNDLDSVSALLNGDASAFLVTDCLSGLFDHPSEIPVNLYPNPAADHVTVEVSEMTSIEIFDVNSKVVMNNDYAVPFNSRVLNTVELQNGIYILKVSGKDFVSFKKLVINK